MNSIRFNFLQVRISAENLGTATEKISRFPFKKSGYVCFPDASVVKAASEDALLLDILNNSFLTLPDGKPSQLAAKVQGFDQVKTVSGYYLLKSLLNSGLTHYFYGGDEEVLKKMASNLLAEFPGSKILGYKSPPFVAVDKIATDLTILNDIVEINKLKPDLVWIGISSPKQDYLMHFHHKSFHKSLLLGVGGVFLYVADGSLKSPEWMKKAGLRWVYRLAKEPKRLWPKYYGTFRFLLANSGFFLNALKNRSKKTPA